MWITLKELCHGSLYNNITHYILCHLDIFFFFFFDKNEDDIITYIVMSLLKVSNIKTKEYTYNNNWTNISDI